MEHVATFELSCRNDHSQQSETRQWSLKVICLYCSNANLRSIVAEEAWRVTQQRRKLLACVWCDVRSNCAESSSSFVPKGRRRQHLRVSPKNLGSYFMFGGRVGARDGGREGGSEGGMEGGREGEQ